MVPRLRSHPTSPSLYPLKSSAKFFRLVLPSPPICRADRGEVVGILLVCKEWCNVALNTPRLWANLDLRIRNPTTDYEDIAVWFSRAKGVPKSLDVHRGVELTKACSCAQNSSAKCQFNDPTLAKLMAVGPALARFRIFFDSPMCFPTFMSAITALNNQPDSRPWDKLLSLTLGISLQGISARQNIFQHLPPNLTTFHLHLRPQDVPVHFEIPRTILNRLKEFSISCSWDGPYLLGPLQHCVNAETISIECGARLPKQSWTMGHPKFPPNVSPSNPITLPKVRTLTIKMQSRTAPPRFLPLLHFPNLVDLRVRVPGHDTQSRRELYDLFHAFKLLAPSSASPMLRSLTIFHHPYVYELNKQALFDVLAGLPSLTHLTLEDIEFDTHSFLNLHRELRKQPDEPKLLPCLEHLELIHPGGDLFDLESVFDFAKSRRKHRVYADRVKFQEDPDSLKKITIRRWFDHLGKLDLVYRTSPSIQQLKDSFGVVVEKF
ncbi:hypothetical protein FA13DRAFT_1798405 [Coprinellus micaceus]|uniref:F-box domain-containing protein n=1 Tax=Coprinellus micaceus TaxID=71717 RepID=A0A4Y7SM91_COPMI|nr:hypothetical protein FA13DRAFT_1798405 [Coprinellus micaceus]